jgi:hypothetical protein
MVHTTFICMQDTWTTVLSSYCCLSCMPSRLAGGETILSYWLESQRHNFKGHCIISTHHREHSRTGTLPPLTSWESPRHRQGLPHVGWVVGPLYPRSRTTCVLGRTRAAPGHESGFLGPDRACGISPVSERYCAPDTRRADKQCTRFSPRPKLWAFSLRPCNHY